MESKAGSFGEVGDGLNERLDLIGFEETLVDVTTTGGVIFKTDSRGETFLETVIEGD